MNDWVDPDLVSHLQASTGLSASRCRRLVLDVLDQYRESLSDFVQRRHRELKARQGLKNEQIYAQILAEVGQRRFAVPQLTERQIRRMIYG
ncbi:MAG: hypothetical protein AAGI88_24030 [Pseudomonadota bacterium]